MHAQSKNVPILAKEHEAWLDEKAKADSLKKLVNHLLPYRGYFQFLEMPVPHALIELLLDVLEKEIASKQPLPKQNVHQKH